MMITRYRFFLCFVFAFFACFSVHAHSAPKTILILGDSLSSEFGIARGSGWVALLEKRLQEQKKNITVINASISGDTTSGGKSRLPTLLEKHKPNIVIIELGGNDGLQGHPISAIEANFNAMIAMSKKAGARVLLLGMQMPPNYGGVYTRQFAAVYSSVAKKTGSLSVPFFLDKIAENRTFFLPDGIHPTQATQPILLNNVWPHLLPLLK